MDSESNEDDKYNTKEIFVVPEDGCDRVPSAHGDGCDRVPNAHGLLS